MGTPRTKIAWHSLAPDLGGLPTNLFTFANHLESACVPIIVMLLVVMLKWPLPKGSQGTMVSHERPIDMHSLPQTYFVALPSSRLCELHAQSPLLAYVYAQ